MHAPRSCKNNNPRKQKKKKEVTIAEFIAGAAVCQNNDRKSSPNNVQKSGRTNMTAITGLKSRKDRQIKQCSRVKFPPTVQYGSYWPKQCHLLPAAVSHLNVRSGADQIQMVFCLVDNFLLTMNPNKIHMEWDASRKKSLNCFILLFSFWVHGYIAALGAFTHRRQWPAWFSAKNA